MVDLVLNHMAWSESYERVQFDELTPFNSSSYFHEYCDIDYDPITVSLIPHHSNAVDME